VTADRRLDPSPLTVAVILGSIRKGRLSERPARLIAERIAAAGHMVRFVDLHALPLPIYDEEEATEQHPNVLAFKELLSGIDASVWLSPEYNFSITAALKNAIEHAPKLTRTPAALCSLSSGQFGGSRALEHLKLIMPDLGAVPIPRIVRFGEAKKLFDGDTLLRPEILQRIDAMLDELFWYAQVLRWGRENLADGA
jgi:NAD(P)H-dependent FMN reductase